MILKGIFDSSGLGRKNGCHH